MGDIDGDGIRDLVVGAEHDDDGGTNRGAVYVLFMNEDGTVREEQKISQGNGGFTGLLVNWGGFGQAIGVLGDLDGDGVPEIAVGERGRPDGGAFWILWLNNNGTVKAQQRIDSTTGGFTGTLVELEQFGTCIVRINDVNNDGIDDLAVCAPQAPGGGTQRGAIWVLYMNEDGTVNGHHRIDDVAGGFTAEIQDVDKFGSSLAVVPDLDGDGIDDWVVGAPLDDEAGENSGAFYVLFMHQDGTVKSHTKITSLTENFTDTFQSEDRPALDIVSLGDLDGDGVTDIAVGSWRDNDGGSQRGAVYIVFLTPEGGVKGYQKISDTQGGFTGQLSDNDHFGFQLTAIQDLNNDGLIELGVGAFLHDDGGTNRGAVWILQFNELEDNEIVIRPREGVYVTTPNFTINEGSGCTADRTVTLQFEGQNIADVVVSSSAEFIGATWDFIDQETMTAQFTLPEGDGEKEVFVRFRSCTLNQSFTLKQTITLDTQTQCPDDQSGNGDAEPVDGGDKPISELDLPRRAISPVTGEMEDVDSVSIGDVIKGKSFQTVYAINDRGRRMPFLNEEMYFTWYSSFENVKHVSDATLSVVQLCHPVNVRPEKVLVKFPDNVKVYYPEDNGEGIAVWRWITSEPVAMSIFGADWNQYVMDVPAEMRKHTDFGENIDKMTDIVVDKSQMIRRGQ